MKYQVGDIIQIQTTGPTLRRKVTRICEFEDGSQCLYWRRGSYELDNDHMGAINNQSKSVTLLKTKCTGMDMEDTRAYLEAITQ